jgi:glycosyltransferase involved in cell wall biosynthesis
MANSQVVGASISIITPTIGRPSLRRLAGELLPQLGECDEWIVVGDESHPEAREVIKPFLRSNVLYHETKPEHFWGYPQRECGLRVASGTHLWGIDDDDRAAPWALETIRRTIAQHPSRPLIFRAIYYGIPIWRDVEPKLYVGNVSSECFVAPNVKGRVGKYGKRYEGDFDFIVSTAALYPEGERAIVWCPEVLSVLGIANAPDDYKKRVDEWVWGK